MSKPTEHKSVQARILKYADEIGWEFITRAEAEDKRGFNTDQKEIRDRARNASLYFENELYDKLTDFNPKYTEEPGKLVEKFNLLKPDIYGNQEFLGYLREKGTFYHAPENRELDSNSLTTKTRKTTPIR